MKSAQSEIYSEKRHEISELMSELKPTPKSMRTHVKSKRWNKYSKLLHGAETRDIMSEPIKKKIQVRNGHKLFVKKIINLTREILQSQDTENIPKLESAKETLLKQRSQMEALDDEIMKNCRRKQSRKKSWRSVNSKQ